MLSPSLSLTSRLVSTVHQSDSLLALRTFLSSYPTMSWHWMKVFRMTEDSIPPTMSTPPVNQVPVFQFYNTERIGLPPSLYQTTLHLVSGYQSKDVTSDNKRHFISVYSIRDYNLMRWWEWCAIHDTRDTAPWYQEVLSLGNIFSVLTVVSNNCLQEVSMFYRKFNGQSLLQLSWPPTVFNGHRPVVRSWGIGFKFNKVSPLYCFLSIANSCFILLLGQQPTTNNSEDH